MKHSPKKRRIPVIPSEEVRSGFLLLEMIVAMILLGTVMAIVVPTLGWINVQNRLALQRQEALQGMHNLMDELTSRPYPELTPEAAAKIDLPPALKRQLPGAKLELQIEEVPGQQSEPNAKRLRLQLGWDQRNGQPLAPMRLTAWVHQPEDDS